jgi:cation diffusion facilitator family transporter
VFQQGDFGLSCRECFSVHIQRCYRYYQVVADAAHSGADVLDSTVTMIAIHLGRKPADRNHPYGHGKTEFVSGAFIGTVLLVGAALIVVHAISRLTQGGHQHQPHFIGLAAAAISIVVNEMMFRYARCAAKKVNSSALEAEAWDNRADCLSSLPVFFGVLGAQFGFRSLDTLAALLVGILVGKVGFELLSKNLHGLMDMPLEPEEIKRVRELVVAVPDVKGISYLRTRGLGRHYLADMQILISADTTVAKSNAIAAQIRNILRREIKHLKDITIVCKPYTAQQKKKNNEHSNQTD